MIPRGVEIFIGVDPIDLRWSFDRLSDIASGRPTLASPSSKPLSPLRPSSSRRSPRSAISSAPHTRACARSSSCSSAASSSRRPRGSTPRSSRWSSPTSCGSSTRSRAPSRTPQSQTARIEHVVAVGAAARLPTRPAKHEDDHLDRPGAGIAAVRSVQPADNCRRRPTPGSVPHRHRVRRRSRNWRRAKPKTERRARARRDRQRGPPESS